MVKQRYVRDTNKTNKLNIVRITKSWFDLPLALSHALICIHFLIQYYTRIEQTTEKLKLNIREFPVGNNS